MNEPPIRISAGLSGRKGDEMIVACDDAGPIIDRLTHDLDATLTPMDWRGGKNGSTCGAVGIISERAATTRNASTEAAARRLYDLREQTACSISLDWYEAYLIATDHYLGSFEIPVFPGGKQAAQDMVEVHAEELSEFEQKRLARSLWNFSRGYFAAISHEKRLIAWREEVERANLLDNLAPVALPVSYWVKQSQKEAA